VGLLPLHIFRTAYFSILSPYMAVMGELGAIGTLAFLQFFKKLSIFTVLSFSAFDF
jgi:hypothetical protein